MAKNNATVKARQFPQMSCNSLKINSNTEKVIVSSENHWKLKKNFLK